MIEKIKEVLGIKDDKLREVEMTPEEANLFDTVIVVDSNETVNYPDKKEQV